MTREDLLHAARSVRDATFGTRVTYSPKVFIPLTKLCRDRCGYCTFAQAPARLDSPYLSPDEVLSIAIRGARAGCHEALFTLGEQPEQRYPVAAAWLAEHGYGSTVDYLVAMAQLVLDETGLLPHANAGALDADGLAALRKVAPSQGMMVESLVDDLECHRGAPDKTPARRLATLELAGELGIPFTTGILVGIGESRKDRVDSARGDRRQPPTPRSRPGGHSPELPAQAWHGDASSAALLPGGSHRRDRTCSPHPGTRGPPAGSAQPQR
ncbi:MAG: 7,8-didemethyl-8-hydroxy-5-deazariboflavin synthase CofG [Microthrixaceae bacterium]